MKKHHFEIIRVDFFRKTNQMYFDKDALKLLCFEEKNQWYSERWYTVRITHKNSNIQQTITCAISSNTTTGYFTKLRTKQQKYHQEL